MNFCTYFDSYYLLKGLGLYLSLERATDDFHLFVMAFDKNCYKKLQSFGFKHMTVELLDDFETPELLAVKGDRTMGEYCWTCGPSIIYHFLTRYKLEEISYLDSDLFFLNDPHLIQEEAGKSSVVITEQGISEMNAKRYGRYCVQYLTFRNDADGLGALTWWRDSCIEWCYHIMEPTRYADQKYLDEFPKRWKNVCVLKNLGAGIAPWNMHRYNYKENTLLYEGKEYPFVFFHMHGTKMDVENNRLIVRSPRHYMGPIVTHLFYEPYAVLLTEVLREYLGQSVEGYKVEDLSKFGEIAYRLKHWIKTNKLVTDIYFKYFYKRKENHIYGTKFSDKQKNN